MGSSPGDGGGSFYGIRHGGFQEDQFHNFLVKARKSELLPPWFDQDAQHACFEVALDAQKDSFISYSMDFQGIEAEYADNTMSIQMRAVAAQVYGREYRFDDPAYANVDPEMMGAMLERQRYNVTRQGFKLLPPRP